MPDFRTLETLVVRRFTNEASGSEWTRLRQSGPSAPNAAGDMITPAPEEIPFLGFTDDLGAKQTVKQPQGQGDNQDGLLTLWTCQTQRINGLEEDVDFTAADPAAGLRGDTIRRESTGELWEVQSATLVAAGRFWTMSIRLVQNG